LSRQRRAALSRIGGKSLAGANAPGSAGNSTMRAAPPPLARGRGPAWSAAAMLAPASIVVTIGIVLPIVILFRYSLNQYTPAKVMVDALTLENYVKFFTDSFYLAILWRTIRVAAVCTFACLVLAFPMAYCLARTRSR